MVYDLLRFILLFYFFTFVVNLNYWFIFLGLDSSWFNDIGKILEIGENSSEKSSRKASSISNSYKGGVNPIDSYSKEFSQWELASNAGEGYEDTLRAFEISQLRQKQRKPRKSNFINLKPRVSLLKNGIQMKVIQEDCGSNKSQDEEKDEKLENTLEGMSEIKE